MLGWLVSVVGGFELGGWEVAAVLVEAAVVEPVDPFGGGDLDVVDGLPRLSGLDQLGLVEAVDGLGQRVEAPIAVKQRERVVAWLGGGVAGSPRSRGPTGALDNG